MRPAVFPILAATILLTLCLPAAALVVVVPSQAGAIIGADIAAADLQGSGSGGSNRIQFVAGRKDVAFALTGLAGAAGSNQANTTQSGSAKSWNPTPLVRDYLIAHPGFNVNSNLVSELVAVVTNSFVENVKTNPELAASFKGRALGDVVIMQYFSGEYRTDVGSAFMDLSKAGIPQATPPVIHSSTRANLMTMDAFGQDNAFMYKLLYGEGAKFFPADVMKLFGSGRISGLKSEDAAKIAEAVIRAGYQMVKALPTNGFAAMGESSKIYLLDGQSVPKELTPK